MIYRTLYLATQIQTIIDKRVIKVLLKDYGCTLYNTYIYNFENLYLQSILYLSLKKVKGIDYIISINQKGIYRPPR